MLNQKNKQKECARTRKTEAEKKIEKIRGEVEKALESLSKSRLRRENVARA
jgi:hypothetical protein